MLLALKYSTWRGVRVFTLMLNLVAMVGTPQAVPMLWCLFTRRGGDVTFWSTLLVGFFFSAILGWLPHEGWFIAWARNHGWQDVAAWVRVNEYAVVMLVDTVVCSAWYWALVRWGPQPAGKRREKIDSFFAAMHTPVQPDAASAAAAATNSRTVVRMCRYYGAFLLAIALFPNTALGRGGLGFCSAFFFGISFLLGRMSRNRAVEAEPH